MSESRTVSGVDTLQYLVTTELCRRFEAHSSWCVIGIAPVARCVRASQGAIRNAAISFAFLTSKTPSAIAG